MTLQTTRSLGYLDNKWAASSEKGAYGYFKKNCEVHFRFQLLHTCETPDGRMNSPVFLGHLPFSNILPYSPDFYMFLPYSPDFCVHVPNVQFAPCAFRPRKQDAIWMTYLWYFESLHSAEVFYSHFKICFNNFIYPPWVDYFTLGWWLFEYLLASTVNFKIYSFKIN